MELIVKRHQLTVDWSWSATCEGNLEDPNIEICLVLHGFLQSGRRSLIDLAPRQNRSKTWVAPDAPFKVARRNKPDGYAWYFFDQGLQTSLVGMDWTVKVLIQGLGRLGVAGRVKRVLGYSQGGYLAPYVAAALPHVQQVVAVNARYRDEDFIHSQPFAFRIDGVNGDTDEIVDPARASECLNRLHQAGFRGRQILVPGADHKWSDSLRAAVQELCDEPL